MSPTDRWILHLTFAMTTFIFLVMFTYFIFAFIMPDAWAVLDGLK